MTQPPRLIDVVLDGFGARPEFSEGIIGDLAEQYARRAESEGLGAARRAYYSQALRSIPHLVADGLRGLDLPSSARLAGGVLFGGTVSLSVAIFVFVMTWMVARSFGACCPMDRLMGRLPLVLLILGVIHLSFVAGGYFTARCVRVPFMLSALGLALLSPAIYAMLLIADHSTESIEGRLIVAVVSSAGCLAGAMAHAMREAKRVRETSFVPARRITS